MPGVSNRLHLTLSVSLLFKRLFYSEKCGLFSGSITRLEAVCESFAYAPTIDYFTTVKKPFATGITCGLIRFPETSMAVP